MNPREHYRKLSFSIKEADIRLVAAILSEHVGEENAVRIETLASRAGMDERKVRIIIERLLTEYRVPVCSISGKPGRWLARTREDTKPSEMECRSRARELVERANAYAGCNFPPTEQVEAVQPSLVDLPEPPRQWFHQWRG